MSHTAETDSLAVDVSAILDAARFGAVQSTVLAFTFFALVMDGFDIQAIAFAAPALTRIWAIERSALGPVFAAALLGMVIGAAGIGLIGDRYGRKSALILSSALVGLGSLASALARSPIELAALRLLTGIGLGGVLPNATALMFEFAPKASRHIATAAALIGVLMGGMVGAGLAKWLIPQFRLAVVVRCRRHNSCSAGLRDVAIAAGIAALPGWTTCRRVEVGRPAESDLRNRPLHGELPIRGWLPWATRDRRRWPQFLPADICAIP